MSEHIEGGFTGTAGGRIYWQGWIPDAPRGAVVISHGVAEHGGRYAYVAEKLNAAGYAVYAIDHRGHGKSEGGRSNVDRIDGVATDLNTLIGLAIDKYPGRPIFLLGHSMGALISLQYLAGTPADLRGAVIIAPPVDVSVGGPLLRIVAPILSAIVPSLGVLQLDSADLSRDPEVVRSYDTDPLNYRGKLPARTGAEILATAQSLANRLGNVTLPLLLLQGTEDKLVAPVSTTIVEESVGSSDLTVKRYEGFYHEVLNEPEKDDVIADVVSWLNAHN